jgi:multidrug efflux pump subunit AcrA (membrane-fusion protein)
MKRNQLILVGVFVLLSALMFFRVTSKATKPISENKEAQTLKYVPVSEVKNMSRNLQLISYGQITPNMELDVSFEVQGKLEKGDLQLKPGVKFKMNQLLFKVNEEEAFYTLSSRKAQLSNLIIGIMPDIELDFSGEKGKWLNFLDQLVPEKRLPELPSIRNTREKMFITSKGILSEYYSIRSLEARMEKYYYLAPFSGTVLEVFAEPGSVVNPGGRIARIARTGELEVKVPIALATVKKFKEQGSADFTDATGQAVGRGNIIRISDVINQKTQSVDVYYSVKADGGATVYNGMYVNVAIEQEATQESFALPRSAVRDNLVSLLVSGKLVDRSIVVVGSKPDTLFVSGLKDGDLVVLEQQEGASGAKVFKGIKR